MDTTLKIPLVISIAVHILILIYFPTLKKKQMIYVTFPIELVSVPPIKIEKSIVEEEKTKEVIAVKKVVRKKKPKPKAKPKPVKKTAPIKKPTKPPVVQSALSLSLDTSKFPFSYYLNQMRRKVSRYWKYDRTTGNLRSIVYFKIRSDGGITGTKVYESSGDRTFNYIAFRAIESAAPFPPLPEAYGEPDLEVYFEFRCYE